ncbi:unnamed protein product [Cylicostephanus goldi]|uniref:MAM domain-containing protein n=1 Tax=Cylicostephanus goldi TaxID=71465 RepID=A0A3P6S1J7_CYLGO|nr:unnamed protein product [Cylicostephanus goldi]
MGDGFMAVPLRSSATGKPIRSAADLDCKDFDACRWRTGGEAAKPWQMSSSPLPRELIFSATGNYVGPEGTYSVLYIEQDTKVIVTVSGIPTPDLCNVQEAYENSVTESSNLSS